MKLMQTISRRTCLALGAGAASTLLSRQVVAAASSAVVVELFTSQGCSSCPPADALLDELRTMPGVVALTYHVDYWDYLGWKDTLGSPEYSQRQYDYAKARGDMDVYTPQMVINGSKHVVGSNRSTVLDALGEARQAAWQVPMSLTDTAKEIIVEIGEGQGDATLWVMPLLGKTSVRIEKGEIAGREVLYHNVVRRLVPAGMWSGKAQRIALPKDGVVTPECTACVALLQQGKVGAVLGCAAWGDINV
jgi:hypothetical protein